MQAVRKNVQVVIYTEYLSTTTSTAVVLDSPPTPDFNSSSYNGDCSASQRIIQERYYTFISFIFFIFLAFYFLFCLRYFTSLLIVFFSLNNFFVFISIRLSYFFVCFLLVPLCLIKMLNFTLLAFFCKVISFNFNLMSSILNISYSTVYFIYNKSVLIFLNEGIF